MLILALPVLACGTGEDEPRFGLDPIPREPTDPARADLIQAKISAALTPLTVTSPEVVVLDTELFQPANNEGPATPDSCNQVRAALGSVCLDLSETGLAASCAANAIYFWQYDTPHCAGRLSVWADHSSFESIYLQDWAGEPQALPDPACGNSVVEVGEECDDGNHDLWDGCDGSCHWEEFTGCEVVIEEYYQLAGLAFVDRNLWAGRRSQVMVHDDPVALVDVDASTCNAAIALGADVCNELVQTMPFVGWCAPSGQLADDETACTVRLEVGFGAIEPTAGVFTTQLSGLLSFTLR